MKFGVNDSKVYADVEAETFSLAEMLESVEKTETQANIDLSVDDELIEKTNNRRDYLFYLAIQSFDITSQAAIDQLATKFNCTKNDIVSDMKTLSNKETWQYHKQRVKDLIKSHNYQKSMLKAARKNDISNKMEQSFSFDEKTLVALAKEFKCRPVHIAEDINHFKKFSTQKQLFIDRKSKAPMIRALTRFARFNIQY
ncbi:hypothetical protein [Shewanella aestuarii]|uniref:Uncharacterized protein n=1 Tax=Shewanella aestuarii TaxID=1028752 RepID=A0A6G9QLY1_9GAMM|nr:hypothetical protein [Shewanella aestuarii]QIR15590.1 hypothetical protein HBH39_14765 [Shewanella aestuarii]